MIVKIKYIRQTFWYVPRYGREKQVIVTSIGRKWAVLDGLRNKVDIDTGIVDGGKYSSPGTLYNSKEEYDEAVMRLKLIGRFEREIRGGRELAQVPTENIIAAAKLLGISLEAA